MTAQSFRAALGVVVVFLAAHASADWTDTTELTSGDYHGPGLKWLGNVHNLDGCPHPLPHTLHHHEVVAPQQHT